MFLRVYSMVLGYLNVKVSMGHGSLGQSRKLYWKGVKAVSRSFYLSLRYLPEAVREPLSLAYLIARLADTIADTDVIPIMLRKQLLNQLKFLVRTPDDSVLFAQFYERLSSIKNLINCSERILIESLFSFFNLLNRQPLIKKQLIQEVLEKITNGQLIDLCYFDSEHGLTHFSTEQELENYLYLVAGCVGEFWTKLCVTYIPNYSDKATDDLLLKAINFGKALQLTNILRDIPQDTLAGRFYLPYQTRPLIDNDESGDLMTESDNSMSVLARDVNISFFEWKNKALYYLSDAWLYIQSIKNRRIQFACLMPFFLAKKTLEVLENGCYIEQKQVIKVSRKQVYLSVVKSLCFVMLGKGCRHEW